jgi:hypothetical protein
VIYVKHLLSCHIYLYIMFYVCTEQTRVSMCWICMSYQTKGWWTKIYYASLAWNTKDIFVHACGCNRTFSGGDIYSECVWRMTFPVEWNLEHVIFYQLTSDHGIMPYNSHMYWGLACTTVQLSHDDKWWFSGIMLAIMYFPVPRNMWVYMLSSFMNYEYRQGLDW